MSAVRERHEMTLLLVSGLSGFFSVLRLVLLFVFIPKAFLRVSVVDSALGLWLA
jgi:VIT1/CCC1 family predicted Fe2+/Mn2+ transporter